MSTSLIPKSLQGEAQGAKVTVSLGLVAALVYGAYRVGADRTVEETKSAEKIAKIEVTLERVVTVLERLETKQAEQARDIAINRDLNGTQSADLQVLDSKVKDLQAGRRPR
jgi:hypothetical protein